MALNKYARVRCARELAMSGNEKKGGFQAKPTAPRDNNTPLAWLCPSTILNNRPKMIVH
jgi:hypothetical protein